MKSRSGQEPPTVATIVVNWNNYPDTSDCIAWVQDQHYPKNEIYIVDNGSTDESLNRLANEYDVQFIKLQTNRGFPAAVNAALSEMNDVEYVWLLNNDTMCSKPELLTQLINYLESEDDVGIVTPLIRDTENSYWFVQGKIDWKAAETKHKFPNTNKKTIENDYVPFCSAVIDTDLFEEIGLLEEQYFLYYEDAEFCTTAQDIGCNIITITEAEIRHKGTASSGGELNAVFSYYKARNRLLFTGRHRSRASQLSLIYYLIWLIRQSVRRIVRWHPESILPLFLGAIDGLLGQQGKGRYPKE